MTSEVIQNKYVEENLAQLPATVDERLELTREQSFLDGTNDIFDILARKRHAHSTLRDLSDKNTNILERARIMLRNAESKISEQDAQLKRLEDVTGHDPVTGLLNRKGFSRTLIREIARTNRGYNDGGLLVIFNLENLANIHKKHGEQAANNAARLVANALEQEIRDMDVAAHIHEDEFVLLFTDTTMARALNRLQNMAMRLNRLSLVWNGEEINLSLSLGLKSYEQGAKPDHVFREANMDLQRNRKQTFET